MDEGALISRVVWLSRAVTWLALVGLVAVFTRDMITKPSTWIAILVAVALGGPAIIKRVRAAEEARRAQVLRRASLLATSVGAALLMPWVLIEANYSVEGVLFVGGYSAVFACFGVAFADVAVARFMPATWRGADTRIWTPNHRQMWILVIAWPLLTWVVFDFITARTGDGSCVDDRCGFGVPYRFLTGPHTSWDKLAVDVALLASLFVAGYGIAASRLRAFFVVYLLAISYWFIAVISNTWENSTASRDMWRDVDMLER